MCARHYENPTMLSKVTAKNVGDVFLRHTVMNVVTMVMKCQHFSSSVDRRFYGLITLLIFLNN